ncbi:unnamed protein product [Gordionus sp. m RMFG-2023]|uniref:beta-alanine transporter-like n=1 Tax=Gordionus sp. m RMFG-2023 TaxID=3053472 RepID=UPI0030E15BEE
MVCDRTWITQFTISMFYFGSLCGHLLFGHIIDIWGRRAGFFSCLTIELLFGILIIYSSNIYMFIICQFAIGLTIASIFDIPFVSSIELVGPTKRAFITILMCFTYACGVVIFATIAYFVRDWKILTLIVDIPFIAFYIYWWFLPESIRWLIVKKKYQRAEKIIQITAKVNKVSIPHNFLISKLKDDEPNTDHRKADIPEQFKRDLLPSNDSSVSLTNFAFSLTDISNKPSVENGSQEIKHHDDFVGETELKVKQLSIRDLLSHPNMRNKTFIITFAWIANVVSYVGIQNYVSFLDNIHLNFLLASLAELPGYIFLWFTLDKIGRRFPFAACMLVSGISVLATNLVFSTSKLLVLVLALIGKIGITTSFAIIYLYASEIYPTELRGTGMALTLTVSRIFTVAVPFITYTKWVLLPTIIMGAITTLAGFLALLLPETLNTNLPETLLEAEMIGLDYSIFKKLKYFTSLF